MQRSAKFDLILYGATGFTGKLTACYLDSHPDLIGKRWAIAGRNADALAQLRDTLIHDSAEVIACSLTDSDALKAMVESTRVVITTAGPYSAYDGALLLGACAEAGVHYSDLSGEGFWQREMIDQFHERAEASGSRIVLGGGVDSIPSDLGMHLALQGIDFDGAATQKVELTGVYTEYSGSFSGGTLASGKARKAALKGGRLTKAAENDPYLLAPGATLQHNEENTADGMKQKFRCQPSVRYGMLFPFFMGKINAPVVRRSLALKGIAKNVSYRECCSVGTWTRIAWLYGSRGLGYPLGEPINFLPKTGEGPPSWMLKQGAFSIEVTAKNQSGQTAIAAISGKGDPGYGATSKMLGEVAICLAQDLDNAPDCAGVLTPATALGDALVDRLSDADNGRFMQLGLV